ncbi:MAG TPA: adenylate/guanylate cyclase domain-containing protein [Candidatus Margulisiibacteriota bacterium]|nr:adenylate/guanylate cyclase domain-containing protein [Candidatus Margulisiibacteriota bacterium]
MNCRACGSDNPSDSAFCEGCGAKLEDLCPSCGVAVSPGARFCRKCGAELQGAKGVQKDSSTQTPNPVTPSPLSYTPKHLADKILTSRAALEGERKQVTVLFADVKGSMELSEQLDPEEWHRILDKFFAILTDGVHRFEGTVNQYTGDGIMALFGAPIAHEDHAQRACYAALHLLEALRPQAREVKRAHGLTLSCRIGLHSGDVVVGKIGDDLRMDYTAQGHTVGLAQRMEALASPDTAYLTASTAALAQGYFDLEDLGEFPVKGVSEPVRVFQLRGIGKLRTRFEVSRARGLTRFVGRDSDMQTLEAALAQARTGNGQVVGIVADAGTGKSRLCFEFLERCRARGLTPVEGRGVAHGKNIPFLPILQVCRDFYGIEENDSDQLAREKIAGRLLLIDEAFREALPLLFDFFGVPDPQRPAPRLDPEARQRQLFGVLKRLFERRDRDGARVVLIEDLHWIDTGSEVAVAQWVDAVASTPTLLLLNFRPEYHADWMRLSYYHQIPLAPLGPEAIAELLDDWLGKDPSIAGLAQAIHRRTGGNPFFAEEVIQSLIEKGQVQGERGNYRLVARIDQLDVPRTVQALLAARIDRLAEREKQVLQTAAVIGKEFHGSILEAVGELPRADLDEALRQLKQSEFVYEKSLYPIAEYAFKHPLTQEVALGSQLQERRRHTHAAVARAIHAAHADKLDERAALLAHHWEEAGEIMEAAGWHRRAAEWVEANDFAAARTHWRKVLDLAGPRRDDEAAARLAGHACWRLLSLGFRLGMPAEEARKVAAHGRDFAARCRDERLLCDIVFMYSVVLDLSGDLRGAFEQIDEMLGILDRVSDDPLYRAECKGARIDVLINTGRLAEGLAACEELAAATEHDITYGRETWGGSDYVWAVARRGWIFSLMGRLAEGHGEMGRALDLARQLEATEVIGWIRTIQAVMDSIRGDVELLLGNARESIRIAEKNGSSLSLSLAHWVLGKAQLDRGAVAEAKHEIEQAIAIARERRTNLQFEARLLADLADAYLRGGDPARARQTAEEAVERGIQQGARFWEAEAQLALARALRAETGTAAREAIEAAVARAQALIEETGGRSLEPMVHEERARLAALLDDATVRAREVQEAARLWRAMGAPLRATALEQELGK